MKNWVVVYWNTCSKVLHGRIAARNEAAAREIFYFNFRGCELISIRIE